MEIKICNYHKQTFNKSESEQPVCSFITGLRQVDWYVTGGGRWEAINKERKKAHFQCTQLPPVSEREKVWLFITGISNRAKWVPFGMAFLLHFLEQDGFYRIAYCHGFRKTTTLSCLLCMCTSTILYSVHPCANAE